MKRSSAIEVYGAETHNLKRVDCRIPHRAVTVVTGPSGAGKSSLAFDTVFAEGQRRFVESMSTYARQFLQQMERPPLEAIENILPAVALEAKNSVKNARSTVGTITEVLDVMRLIYTHLGAVQCPEGHGRVKRYAPEEAAADLVAGAAGESFLISVTVDRPRKEADTALRELVRQGYARRRDGDSVVRMESSDRWPKKLDPLELVLGRFKVAKAPSARLVSAIEEAYRLGGGRMIVRGDSGDRFYSRGLGCAVCGSQVRRPVPALFSFNSPLGACPDCQGFGRVIGIDPDRVVPDPTKTLLERPIAPWSTPAYEDRYDRLYAACEERGVPLDVPWAELDSEDRDWIWHGKGPGKSRFTNIARFFAWLERRAYRVHVRVLLAKYRAYNPCDSCNGTRLRPEASRVLWNDRTIAELSRLSIEALRRWFVEQRWTPRQLELAGHLFEELGERLEVLDRVGLGYLTVDRQARTLSGGETQRIHLAAALGSGLTETLYVLDEPTIGLHPNDSDRLLALMRDLAARGNTVLVVEHDRTIIQGADHVIDLGPAAGELGGEVIAQGTPEHLKALDSSITGRYLRQRPQTAARRHLARFRREQGRSTLAEELAGRRMLKVRRATAHNLRGIDIDLPRGTLVAVTGVSGSGKSTLVENVIHANFQRERGVVDVDPGSVGALDGFADLDDVVLVDQQPLGRSSRSNPITYLKAYDLVRKLFAQTPTAKKAGISAGHFSFNIDRGRCPHCKGTGVVTVDMQFMTDVTVTCEHCGGRRFRSEVLGVRYRGLDIAQTLELTVREAIDHFTGARKLVSRLSLLADVGLDYLRLGQPTSTLSGGEAQRLKLATFLDKGGGGESLFLFDEPTTGLHLADIDLLSGTLRRLVQAGHTVLFVEHSVDLIAHADWIVDLGPGGGVHGGDILYAGPLEGFLDTVDSPTAVCLREHLGWGEGPTAEVADVSEPVLS